MFNWEQIATEKLVEMEEEAAKNEILASVGVEINGSEEDEYN